MDQKQIKTKVSEGYILARSIIEVIGKPKEYIEKSLKGYISKVKANEDIIVVKEDFKEAKEHEDELFVTFVELESLFKDSMALLSFCFDYMPSSIEIIEPGKMLFNSFDFTDFLNDMQARLHAVNMGLSNFQNRNLNLIKNTSTLMKNFVIYSLQEPKEIEEIAKITGIKLTELLKLMGALEDEEVVLKKGNQYKLIRTSAK